MAKNLYEEKKIIKLVGNLDKTESGVQRTSKFKIKCPVQVNV
jgi:hypothetical protein